MNKFFAYAIVSFIGFYFSGCGGGNDKKEVTEHKIGEKILADKIALTIQKVIRNAQPEFPDQTKSGVELLGIKIRVANEGKYPKSFKLEELILKDAAGKIYRGSPQGGPGSLLSTGRYLALGDKISGTLLFEVPAGSKGMILRYEPKKLKTKVFLIRLN